MSEPWGTPSEPRKRHGQRSGQQQPELHPHQNYHQGRPTTPYLDRDPYRELSEANLEQEARQHSALRERSDPFGEDEYRDNAYREPYRREHGTSGRSASRYHRPAKQTNGLAIAGAIFFFVPLVGLVLSIAGRAVSKARGGAGKTAGTVGILLSLLFTTGLGVAVFKISHSTAADPACLSGESDIAKLLPTLEGDNQALASAKKSGDKTTFVATDNKLAGDLQTLRSDLESAQTRATHGSVRTAIQNFDADLGTFDTGLEQVLHGDTSNEAATGQAASRLVSDSNAVTNVCGNVTNG